MTLIETRDSEVLNVLYHGLRDEKLGESLELEYTKPCYRTNPPRASEIRAYLNRQESSRDVRRQRKTTPYWGNETTPYQRSQTPPAPHQQQNQPVQQPYQPSYQQGHPQNQSGSYNQQSQGYGQHYQPRRVNFAPPPGTDPDACWRCHKMGHQAREFPEPPRQRIPMGSGGNVNAIMGEQYSTPPQSPVQQATVRECATPPPTPGILAMQSPFSLTVQQQSQMEYSPAPTNQDYTEMLPIALDRFRETRGAPARAWGTSGRRSYVCG